MGSTYLSSPDEASHVFPERLIRPLPKRTIRSRLSQEAADSISYPPNPPSTSLPAYSHYDYEHDQDSYQDEDDHEHDCPHHHHHHCHHHDEDEDELESADDPSPIAQRQSTAHRSSPRSPRSSRHTRYGSYGAKGSSAADSYEAFENTNNKKKRKIPTSGSLNLHQSSLNAGMAHMALNSSKDGAIDDSFVGSYPPSSSPGGVNGQGVGRGRSKKQTFRNPLGISVNGSNIRSGNVQYDQSTATGIAGDDAKADQGIISKAIANATTLLRNPLGKGQENVGVLDQRNKTTPTNSQFTFTCETENKGVKFPEQSLYSPDYAHRANAASSVPGHMANQKYTQGTQTSANNAVGQQPMAGQQSAQAGGIGPNNQRQKPRRKKGDVYALAARQRKLQQEYTNLQHPPVPADIWICEFCEYESIFGSQPHALVRQYEIKDRRERKRLAEKRRLLEKAKLKGRKGKKQTKNAAKAANSASQQPMNQQAYDQQHLDQMDDYLDDGYDDDPISMPVPPPQAPTKQPMPGSYNASGTGKANASSGPGGGGNVR